MTSVPANVGVGMMANPLCIGVFLDFNNVKFIFIQSMVSSAPIYREDILEKYGGQPAVHCAPTASVTVLLLSNPSRKKQVV